MRIKLLLFAHLGDIGGKEIELEMPDKSAVGDVFAALASANERSGDALASTRAAVNGEWATRDTLLHDGDEVALIPPVSGG